MIAPMTGKLHRARIEELNPGDTEGPYFFVSHDGERWYELSGFPADAAEEAEWLARITEEATRTGPGEYRLAVHRRLLEYGGATFEN